MSWKSRAIKTARVAGTAAAVAAALLLLLAGLFLVPQVRERVLSAVLPRIERALPGHLAVRSARWPSPGTLTFEGVAWTDGPDTLAAVDALRASVDLLALTRRDLDLTELSALDLRVDIAAMRTRFARFGSEGTAKPSRSKPGFPRPGALPGLPSVAVARLDIDAPLIRVSDALVFRGVVLRAGFDLRHGSPPRADIRELTLSESASGATVDSLWFSADLSRFEVDGSGTIDIPGGDSWYLACHSGAEHDFHVYLTTQKGDVPPETVGLALDGKADFAGRRPQAADFELRFRTPGTEELMRYRMLAPALSRPLSKVAPLEGASGVVAGTARWEPDESLDATLDLFRNAWLDTLHASAAYAGRTWRIDTLEVASSGLELAGTADIPPSGGSASARLLVSGSRWLERVVPDASLPEGTTAELTVAARGLVGTPERNIGLRGSATVDGRGIDEIELSAALPTDRNRPYDIDVRVAAMGTSLATRARIQTGRALEVRLAESPDRPAENRLTGDLRYSREDRRLRLTDLRLWGSLGQHTASADLDSLLQGPFAASLEWPEAPLLLLGGFRADSVALARADSAWRADGPFGIQTHGTIFRPRRRDTPVVTASATLRLPGPRELAPLDGRPLAVGDLGPIEGWLELTSGDCAGERSLTARMDLSRTSWLDTALVEVDGCGAHIAIDTALVAFEHLTLGVAGQSREGRLDLLARLVMADSLVLTRLFPDRPAPSVSLDATVRASGPAASPGLAATLQGTFRTPKIDIPRIAGSATLADDSLRLRVDLAGGVRGYGVVLDSVSLTHSGSVRPKLTGRTSVFATGSDAHFLCASHWARDGQLSVRGDTLYLAILDRDLESRRPFLVDVSPGGEVRVEGLALGGSIGRVTADGYTSPDSADFKAEIIVHAPHKPGFFEFADRLWPDSLIVTATADGPMTFDVAALVDGVEIADHTPVRAKAELHSAPGATSASVEVDAPDRRLLEITGTLPAYHLGQKFRSGPVILDARIDRFPVPGERGALTADEAVALGWLDGRIAVRGTADDPCAVAVLKCHFSNAAGVEMEKYLLDVEGQLTGKAQADTAIVRIRRDWFRAGPPAAPTQPGLSALLSLTKAGQSVLKGDLTYPVRVSLSPLAVRVPADGQMTFDVKSSNVVLTDFDPLLPPDLHLEGTCAVQLSAAGSARNPSLEGTIRTHNAQVTYTKEAQITPDIALDLGGTMARPRITGEVQIRNGFIRIPERQQELYPAKGTSILWEAADTAGAAADTARAHFARGRGDSLRVLEIETGLDVNVRVKITGAFRIIGSRMNVELSGDMQIVKERDRPVLTGHLVPLSGQLLFMGRTFELRRGSVDFYGGDELNPTLDLTLVAEVAGYRIEIRLTGTAKEPEISLTSEPQLAESDIMSLLVFGKPMNELNTSQAGLVQQRTAEILMVYGAVKLQEALAQQMGVDIITIQQSTRKPEESALVVGKYINSRTLIKYEQNIENTGAYLINLEYYVTKRVKFETFVDQASETGIEINWSTDY